MSHELNLHVCTHHLYFQYRFDSAWIHERTPRNARELLYTWHAVKEGLVLVMSYKRNNNVPEVEVKKKKVLSVH